MGVPSTESLVIEELKKAMGYKPRTCCCKNCKKFVPDDCSGNPNAKAAHCTLNPAIDIPVDEQGLCDFLEPKVKT